MLFLHKITKLTSPEKNKNKNKKDFNYVLTKFHTSYITNKERRKINCQIETQYTWQNPVNDGAHEFVKLWGLLSLLALRVIEHQTLLQTLLFTGLFRLLS